MKALISRNGSPATLADVLTTNFSQTAEFVHEFPHQDVFMTAKSGPEK